MFGAKLSPEATCPRRGVYSPASQPGRKQPSALQMARPYKEPLGVANASSAGMRSAFGHDCGGQRLMRGEQLFRTDKVAKLTTVVCDGRVCFAATVLSQDYRSNASGGAYSTRVYFDVLTAEQRAVAVQLLGKQAEWASLVDAQQQQALPFYLHGKAVTDLAEPLINALACLPIIPQACSQVATATCTCGDFRPDAWCKHVAAVGFQIIKFCETDPFYPFYLRQLDVAELAKTSAPKRARQSDVHGASHPKQARRPEAVSLLSDDDEEGGSRDFPIVCG